MIKFFRLKIDNKFEKVGVVDSIPTDQNEYNKIKNEAKVDSLISYKDYMKIKED